MNLWQAVGLVFIGIAMGAGAVCVGWLNMNSRDWDPTPDTFLEAYRTVHGVSPTTDNGKEQASEIARRWWHALRAAIIASEAEA